MPELEIKNAESDITWDLYTEVGPNDGMNQGDLIRFNPELNAPKYGIVVTADCDLENRKHSRLVTLVPFLSVEDIIKRSLAFDFFEKADKATDLKIRCRNLLGIDTNINDPRFIATVKAILREGKLSHEHEVLARIVTHESTELELTDIKYLINLLGIKWANVVGKFKDQIGSRGDMLLLAKPPLVEDMPQIAWLRAIWQEQIANIAIRTSEEMGLRGIRIANLRSPFRYRLTQLLGSVFSDIGLPDLSQDLFYKEIKELES
jgi:hypothetical protein